MDKSSFKELYSKATLALSSINPTKTQEPLGFPGWLLKGERADIFATPIMDRRENFNAHNTLAPQLWLLIIRVSFGLPSERKPINDQFNISENAHSGPYFVVFLKIFFWIYIYIFFRGFKHRVNQERLLRWRQTTNVNLYRVTKFSIYLSFTVHHNYTKIGRFTPILSILNCFTLFLSAHFSFWKFLNLNLTFAVCPS